MYIKQGIFKQTNNTNLSANTERVFMELTAPKDSSYTLFLGCVTNVDYTNRLSLKFYCTNDQQVFLTSYARPGG